MGAFSNRPAAMRAVLSLFTFALMAFMLVAGDGPDDEVAAPPSEVFAAAAAAADDTQNPCRCQCNTYTYTRGGEVHGNCKSVWGGDFWCYVNQKDRKHCRDIQYSKSGRAYSWEACITPTTGSGKCDCLAKNGLSKSAICECICPPGSPSDCYDKWCPRYY